LDEVLIALHPEAGPAKSGHDAGRDCLPKPERVADRQHEVTDFETIAIS
jgi:hypothetical protein